MRELQEREILGNIEFDISIMDEHVENAQIIVDRNAITSYNRIHS